MSPTRDNHYVPRWYQEGFRVPGQTKLAYLDMAPTQHSLPDGQIKSGRSIVSTSYQTGVLPNCDGILCLA